MPNWFKGITEAGNNPPASQVAKSGFVFIDPNFVGTSTGLPAAPYKSLTVARATETGAKTFVCAAFNYTEQNIPFIDGDKIVANIPGQCYLSIYDIFNTGTGKITIEGFTISGGTLSNTDLELINCKADSISSTGEISINNRTSVRNSTLFVSSVSSFDECNLINVTVTNTATLTLNNSHVDILSTFSSNPDVSFCNFRSPSSFNDLGSNIDEDPLNTGQPSEFEYVIPNNSPLIGAAENNDTIGGFKFGSLVDLSSTAENNDIDTTPPIETINNATVGNVKPVFREDELLKSSTSIANGTQDFVNNLPDAFQGGYNVPEVLIKPVAYKPTIGGGQTTKNFIDGMPMMLDDSGNSTGQTNSDGELLFNIYDVTDDPDAINLDDLSQYNKITSIINQAEIQENFTLQSELDYSTYGTVQFLFRVNRPDYFDLQNAPTDSRIQTWFDQSANAYDMSAVAVNNRPGYGRFKALEPSGRRYVLLTTNQTPAVAKYVEMASTTNTDYLHQGAVNWSIYFEINNDNQAGPNNRFGIGTNSGTGTGILIFVNSSDQLQFVMYNGASNLVSIVTSSNSFINNQMNYGMVTFNSSTREVIVYINSDTPASAIAINNFSAGVSVRPFFFGNNISGLNLGAGEIAGINGTILSQANFEQIRDSRQKFYSSI